MITSYTVLLDRLRLYCESQLTIKRFGGEFKSELNNFANENEKFPIIYVTSISQQIGINTTQFELDIYCLDLLLDDRSNYGANSDCKLILNDLYNYYEAEYDWDVNVVGTANIYDLNNQLLDTAIGGVMRITLEVANYTSCSIPFKDGPIYFESDSCSTQTFQYLTCDSVTGCTSLQEYVAEQIASIPSGTSVSSFTYEASANTLTIELSDNTTFDVIIAEMSGMTFNGPVSATTFYGDGSNLTGINATEVTGFTFNPATYEVDLNQSNDSNFKIDLSILASDVTITGGTYNPSTGTATFTNNSGDSFNVSGFLTGFTDIYTTGATYNPSTGVAIFTRNDGQTYSASGFFTGSTDVDNYLPLSGGTLTGQLYSTVLAATAATASGIVYVSTDGRLQVDPADLVWDDVDKLLGINMQGTIPSASVDIHTNGTQGLQIRNTATPSSTAGAGIIGLHDSGVAMTSGNRLGFLVLGGANSTTGSTRNSVSVEGFATEAWTTTNSGSKMVLSVTPNTTNTRATAVTIDQDKSVTFENTIRAKKFYWTVELMDALSVEFYTTQDVKIASITNVLNSPTITIADDGVVYTLGDTILSGSKITVTASTASVIKLNIEL